MQGFRVKVSVLVLSGEMTLQYHTTPQTSANFLFMLHV